MDAAVPFIKRTKGSKKTSKVWVLLYLYDHTKALHNEVVEDYSGAEMVIALQQTFTIRNMPSQLTFDPGQRGAGYLHGPGQTKK